MALSRLFCVAAQSRGTRSRVRSLSASPPGPAHSDRRGLLQPEPDRHVDAAWLHSPTARRPGLLEESHRFFVQYEGGDQ